MTSPSCVELAEAAGSKNGSWISDMRCWNGQRARIEGHTNHFYAGQQAANLAILFAASSADLDRRR